MMDDLYVLEKYVQFIVGPFTELDRLQENEKTLLGKMNFLNKGRTIHSIWWSYDHYRNSLRFEWEKIYFGEMHSYETQDNWELLSKGGTLYAKTEVQKLVEQFFYRLSVGVLTLTLAYDKNESEKDREQDKILWDGVSSKEIDEYLNKIFPFAMNVFDNPEALVSEKDKAKFLEVNKKHGVDVSQALKFVHKETPRIRNLVVTEKPTSAGKYWLAENGSVRCLDDKCPESCNMGCPIFVQTQALGHLVKNEFAEAARLLLKAVEIEPTFADAWDNLAAAYGQMGDHRKAYESYKKAYELLKKPNPLYGMAVASKNMKAYPAAMQYAKMYVDAYGSDSRISSLIAEISEKSLAERVSSSGSPDPALFSVNSNTKRETPVQQSVEKGMKTPVENPEVPFGSVTCEKPIDLMWQYGNAYLNLLDGESRADGYRRIAQLEENIPEAGVALGQYYQVTDKEKAKEHFKLASDNDIAEGKWGYACMLWHSPVFHPKILEDVEWEKYCLGAAEAECRDAAHEMGNVCYKRGSLAEAVYWYELAFALGYNNALKSISATVSEWSRNGKSEDYIPGTKNYTEQRHKAAIIYLKHFIGKVPIEELRQAVDASPDRMLGYYTGNYYLFREKNDEKATGVFSKLAAFSYPYAWDRYGKQVMRGKGTEKDYEAGVGYIRRAARKGCVQSMVSMGSFAAIEKDYLTAAYWYAQAYARGDEQSLQKLQEMKAKMSEL